MFYALFAPGFEEIEAITAIDVLRRADIEVTTVGVGTKTIVGAHNIAITCDTELSSVCADKADGVILPGGMPGTLNLYASEQVRALIKAVHDSEKYVCAICAAPLILGRMGLLKGKKAVCYPGFEAELDGATVTQNAVEIDGKLFTSRGPGTAMAFALAIVSELRGADTAQKLKEGMQCR